MALTLQQLKARFQDPMRMGVVDILWQSSRVMQRMHFIEHRGLSYPYSQRVRLPGVAFRSLNAVFPETVGVINPSVELLTILGGAAKTDSVMIELKGTAARQNEVASILESSAKAYDRNFFHGDPATSPNSFQGLRSRLVGNQVIEQAANGALPTHKKVVELQDRVNGPNSDKVLFMNQTTRRNLSFEVDANAGGMGKFDVGRQIVEFNGSEIVEVYKDEAEEEILKFNETQGGSGVTCSMYCAKMGGQIDERDVQGIMGLSPIYFQVRGPFDYGEYVRDVVQGVGGMGIFGGYSAARLKGILAV